MELVAGRWQEDMKAPLLVLFIMAVPAWTRQPESILDALGQGFGKTSPVVMILLAVVLIAAIGALVAWEIFKSDEKQKTKSGLGWQVFGEQVLQRGLTQKEAELLKQLIKVGNASSADLVFTSSAVYENCVDALLSKKVVQQSPDLLVRLRQLREKLGYDRIPVEVPVCSTRQLSSGYPVNYYVEGESVLRKAQVEEMHEDRWSVKLQRGDGSSYAVGKDILVSFIRFGDGEYSITTKVSAVNQAAALVTLEHSRSLKRKQMRNFVRVEVNLPCRAALIRKPSEAENENENEDVPDQNGAEVDEEVRFGQTLEGRMVDVSGGGTCARFPSPLQSGSLVNLNFDLPGSSVRGIRGEVLRLSKKSGGARDVYEHHIKFVDIETAVQEKIVRYVFEKQRMDAQWR